MSLADPLRLTWLDGITAPSGKRVDQAEAWLSKNNVTVTSPYVFGSFSVYISDPRSTVNFFAHDADRFSSAAFESLLSEAPRAEFPRATAWSVIRGYYSAFFALHAIMRIQGRACIRISKAVAGVFNEDLSFLYPESDKIDAGLFHLISSNGGAEVKFKKLDVGAGATHEALWSLMKGELNRISTIALTDLIDPKSGQELALLIDRLFVLLDKKGGPGWLSQIRNRVNYAHSHGAWSPYRASTCDTNRLLAGMNKWRSEKPEHLSSDPMDELIQFSEICSIIVFLCRITISDLVYRSKPNSPLKSSSANLLASAAIS